MQVRDMMSADAQVANPQETIQQASRLMASIDAGFLPVGEDGHLVGMITDRDIAVRAVALGRGPDTPVRDVMTSDVKYCFMNQEIEDVTANMGEIQVRRLPVLDRNKRLVGVISLGDIALASADGAAGEALAGISRPDGDHTQLG